MIARLAALWLLCTSLLLAPGCDKTDTQVIVPPAASQDNKTVGPGDVIEIRVGNHEEISGAYEVAEDGTIRFPWIGDVKVRGSTLAQVSDAIEKGLADGWLKQPQVAVRVTERMNREVSVLGQVKEAGSYPFKPGMTLMQAIGIAGGMNPLAMPRKVKLIRETDAGRKTFEVDTTKIIESRAEDFALEPGDIVFVPESPV
ncbi:MAG: polysaccharide export protein [Deltaproteobacteria bacterium]|nr:polysaccharide export protein [Nannocystaceae bacterium]